MTFDEVLRNACSLIGENAVASKRELERSLETATEAEITGIHTMLAEMREREKRVGNYSTRQDGSYICPHCWVLIGEKLPLRSINGGDKSDIYTCDRGDQFEHFFRT